jgi:hypothetical protein
MEFLEMQSVHLPGFSPLAVNAASSIFGLISIFFCYKALVAKKLVSTQCKPQRVRRELPLTGSLGFSIKDPEDHHQAYHQAVSSMGISLLGP